jgi:glycerophosphoryl diester phosphodiesterase
MNALLDPAAKLVIAHRGNSAHCPENTLESFRQGLALGADAIEFDVRLSRDGVAVVIHDPTLERTTDGAGSVAALTLDELRRLDAGHRFTPDGGATFPYRGRGITIPTLELVLSAFSGVHMIVEIKAPEAAAEVKRLLTAAGAAGRCLVGSFHDAALAPFRGTPIAHSASRRELIRLYARAIFPGSPSRQPWQALAIPPSFDGIPLPVMRFARMARRAGAATHVWTVDDPARALRYLGGAVNGIITNDPGTILSARGAGPASRPLTPAA